MEPAMGGEPAKPELHVAVGGGQTGPLDFTPTKPGAYEFWCTASGHQGAGKTGTLVALAP